MSVAPQSRIRAVIFDFGGVICFPPSEAQWQEAAAFCGADRVQFEAAFWQDRDRYDAGGDALSYWKDIGARLNLKFCDDTINGLIAREIQFWSHFDERVLAWAKQLRSCGIRTGILSNLPRTIGRNLRSIPGFLGHFDEITFSYELGVIKPAIKIYECALAGLQLDPREAVFLDDRADNVEGARAAGLYAELFTTWKDFLANGPAKHGLPAPAA